MFARQSIRTNGPASRSALMASLVLILALMSSAAPGAQDFKVPETVTIKAGSFSYRQSGEFLKNGYPVDGPLEQTVFAAPFDIMKFQVTVGQYEACVAEKACGERLGQGRHAPDLPVTGVSYKDVTDFARWFSKRSGKTWRLPTDEEWAYAAGSRFMDDALKTETDFRNPAARWLLKYKQYANAETGRDPLIKVPGAYGENENGLFDLAGNIWEWTDTCYYRHKLDEQDNLVSTVENCGVRIVEGLHRGYISFFIQDAKGGGCAVGAPPDYLGFRLIKEPEKTGAARFLHWIGIQ